MPSDPGAADQGPPDASAPSEQLTRLLNAVAAGDSSAANELFDLVYSQLRAIAQRRMVDARPGHTLQATALVNEAYLRLLGKPSGPWAGRAHFFRTAALAMRQILIDHARAQGADKRGGGRAALSIKNVADLAERMDPAGFLALDDVIQRFEEVDAMAASVVRLRFYAGLSLAEVAEALGMSERTVRREWTYARGWLRDALERQMD